MERPQATHHVAVRCGVLQHFLSGRDGQAHTWDMTSICDIHCMPLPGFEPCLSAQQWASNQERQDAAVLQNGSIELATLQNEATVVHIVENIAGRDFWA